ncbi:hypothetical protein DCAR_0415226 [Daucus carota subsp. sativus]|uniref:Uncharacterized protein n=1 Tax=Daucus carota subsp. sativus TaxID=79200 RepID=A0AAF1AWN4_DAUCS|nr:hypothetical protein DCAR_0415226 [Daucus carota subsp. sativus]
MNQNEALAAEDNIEAVLEKVKDMTSQEADAAVHKALQKCCVAVRASENMYIYQTLLEAADKATAKCDAAAQVLQASLPVAVNAKRLVEAIDKAREKRPMTDCESGGASSSYGGASSSY